jgi:hypothetical protein
MVSKNDEPEEDALHRSADAIAMRRVELSAAPIGRLINIMSVISGAIAIGIIASVVAIALLRQPIPDELSNWGGIILGFYFGQFVTLLKDYMGIVQNPRQRIE